MPGAYEIAQSWTGTKEGDAALNDFLYNGGRNLDSATRAWCSDFIKAAAAKSGVETKATGMARSWLNEGTPVDQPQPGDIAVFDRPGGGPGAGHVGFYEGTNPDGTIKILSGNHADSVGSGSYSADRLLGYRRLGPAQDPRNVAMNGGQAGVDPDGFAGVSGSIHTAKPGDAGVPFAPKPLKAPPAPGMPASPVGGFGSSMMAGLTKGIGAFADSLGGGQDDGSAQAMAQINQANSGAIDESERAAQGALDLVRKRKKTTMKPRMGAFA